MKKFVVSKEESNQTLEKFVKKSLSDAPLGFIYKLFRKKDVKVNGHWQDSKFVISEGDEISIFVTDQQYNDFVKERENKKIKDISSWIIYEDSNIILVNKPRGILVQKDSSNDAALDDMVISYLINKKEYQVGAAYTPAPVHRLDRNTAGIVIFGKNLPTLQSLALAIQDKNKITKKYLTLVEGIVDREGSIDIPLKKLTNGRVIKDDIEGKESHTLYSRTKTYKDYSLVEVTLLTGRTHQIRVHFSLIGHPVIGDAKYGNYSLNKKFEKTYGFNNQFLCSYYLKFNNLDNNLQYLNGKEFKIDLPNDLMDLLVKLMDN